MKLSNYNTCLRMLKVAQSKGVETLPQLMTLLYIAQARELGRTVSEVRDHLGMSQSAASRSCRYLYSTFNAEREGLDLVESYHDPLDVRSKFFRLNDKGRAVVSDMEN